jgi:DUF4097 and DUF4098 domain-containing protein YvlB
MMNWRTEEEKGEERITGKFTDVEISNISGDISISGWDNDTYLLSYTKNAPSLESLEGLKVEIDSRDDKLVIKREFEGSGISPRGTISFRLNIPREVVTRIKAHSINGKIHCTNMSPSTEQDLFSTSGRILTDNSGDLTAKTVSGSVDFLFNGRNLDIKTTSGRIEGEIETIDPRGKIALRSISGSVRITLPDDFSGKLDLRSVSGTVSTDFPVQAVSTKRNSLEGTIGEGKIPVDITTTSGSIRIRKLSEDE